MRARATPFTPPSMRRVWSPDLAGLGLEVAEVSSQARDRRDYLRRPDLGRMLDPDSRSALEQPGGGACELVIVVGDGLSPAAVNVHAVELVRQPVPRLAESGIGSAASWSHRARGSRSATRSAPCSARAWW